MVDFSKAINNEQMVNGLKKLLHLNEAVIAKCQSARLSATEGVTRETLDKLIRMHERHINMLADSIHFLGGSSGEQKRKTDSSPSSGAGNSLLIEIEEEEQKLQKAYMTELKRLKASDEVVNVINNALVDAQDVKTILHRARQSWRARA